MSVQRAVNGRNFIFEVRKPDDTFVGLFQIHSYLHVANLRREIVNRTDACTGSFFLMFEDKLLRDCKSISNVAPLQCHVLVTMLPRRPNLRDKNDYLKFCAKCLVDAGASALLILQVWTEKKMPIDALVLHRAGFALRDVLHARARFPSLDAHPPESSSTLFDSQLKKAGYTATDFRQIGYSACQMSRIHFLTEDPEMTEGEREWEETMAFFSADELREAGFDAEEVRIAFDREQNLPSRSRSPRRRACFSDEYERGYVAGYAARQALADLQRENADGVAELRTDR